MGTPRPGCCEGLEPGRLAGRWALHSFLSLREKEAANSEAEMRPVPSPPLGRHWCRVLVAGSIVPVSPPGDNRNLAGWPGAQLV